MKNKTQLDICKQAAISSGFLSLLLSGDRRPSWPTAKRLAEVTGTEPALWLEGTPEALRQIVMEFIQTQGGDN
jgi:transcriptional regulator with XRE-family HTH domain